MKACEPILMHLHRPHPLRCTSFKQDTMLAPQVLLLWSILSTLHQLQTAQSRMSIWKDGMEGVMDGEKEGAMEQLGAAAIEQLE